MSNSILVVALAAFFLVGVFIDVIVHRFFKIDEDTLTLFKFILRHRNIDLKAIPDATLIDTAAVKTEEAKKLATAFEAINPGNAGWKHHLVRLLEDEAGRIETILRDGPERHQGQTSTRLLLKYGIVEPLDMPTMTIDEFVEAVKDGMLFDELERRLSLRKKCKNVQMS